MSVVVGLIALAIVSILYLFVSSGGILWPGGPQLQPEGARNLSIALILVALLLCGVIFSNAAQPFLTIAQEGNATRIAQLTAASATQSAGGNGLGGGAVEPTSDLSATTEVGEATPFDSGATASRTSTPTIVSGTVSDVTAAASATPARPAETATATPTLTREPSATPTETPSALPLDPRELVESVLGNIIPRANDAQAAAILSGDGSLVNELWTGQARVVVLNNVRRVRSRFIEVTEVSWAPSGEGIRLLSSSAVTATYTTSETWTFVGTIAGRCSNGAQPVRRFVETYPAEQYLLKLEAGAYTVDQWQLGPVTINEARSFCP